MGMANDEAWQHAGYPLLFNRKGKPKPAFREVMGVRRASVAIRLTDHYRNGERTAMEARHLMGIISYVGGFIDCREEMNARGTPMTIDELCVDCPQLVGGAQPVCRLSLRERVRVRNTFRGAKGDTILSSRTSPKKISEKTAG